MSKRSGNPLYDHFYWILIGSWFIVQGILLWKFGIVTTGEAPKYLNEALYFRKHLSFSEPKYIFYSPLIFLHLVANILHVGKYGVLAVQLLINLFATIRFADLARKLFGKTPSAVFCGLALVFFIPLQIWNTHLYTESLFISFTILFTVSLIHCIDHGRFSIGCYTLGLLVLFTRPTGMLVIPAVMILLTIEWILASYWWRVLGMWVLGLLGFGIVLELAMKGEGEFDFMKPFIEGHIICGVPTGMADRINLPADGNSLSGLWYFASHNSALLLDLAEKKLIAFWGMTRTYYSTAHNYALMILCYPLYSLALFGLLKGKFEVIGIKSYIFILCCFFCLSVLFSCDDWLNRFIMPLFPFLLLLAFAGLRELFPRMKRTIEYQYFSISIL